MVLINPTDYFLYLPLMPEVAAGILDPSTPCSVGSPPSARSLAAMTSAASKYIATTGAAKAAKTAPTLLPSRGTDRLRPSIR